jgi:hypothetical protein
VPERAYDGKPETRWSTGFRSKGVWYALDLGGRVFVDEGTLDTEKSPHDTPAFCDVFVSLDGDGHPTGFDRRVYPDEFTVTEEE